jgi:hypothetical protein
VLQLALHPQSLLGTVRLLPRPRHRGGAKCPTPPSSRVRPPSRRRKLPGGIDPADQTTLRVNDRLCTADRCRCCACAASPARTCFIPISIGALTGVTQRDAGVASGLLNTSQNLGGTVGVAVASSIAASHFRTLVQHGYTTPAALADGFRWALWVCGLTAVLAVAAAVLFIRRSERPRAVTPRARKAAIATAGKCPYGASRTTGLPS